MVELNEIRRMRPLLGTYVEIGVAGRDERAHAAISAAFAEIATLHALLSFQQPDSELSQLNGASGGWVQLSPVSMRVLCLARAMTLNSDRLFNCTVGGVLVARGVLPDHLGIECLAVGDASDIEIDAGRARLRRPVRITLDGIAKGFAVDRAVAVLKRHGVAHGWVNAGGDLRVFGDRVLPVAQRQAGGAMQALGGLRRAAIATSHAVSEPDANMPGFIVRPANAAVRAAADTDSSKPVFSVIARFAWRADALTKVAAVAPVSERAQRVAALGGLLLEESVSCAA